MPSVNPEQSIFLAALELPTPAERAAYLFGACAADPALLANVRALLASHENDDGFLDRIPPNATVEEQPVTECPGTVIGPYKLLEQIGEGGFGVVFMAEQQQPVRRKVALKVLKAGMDTHRVVARFEAERQALALMEHPNIARVLDGGATARGRPYFVMELVRGMPLTQFCDERQLPVLERLRLFVDVCRAVQHAHQKGIIHRDLKPSNLLVTLHDGVAVPKVIDFGIAKALGEPLTERTLFTGFAQLLGTPSYMSPEQAELSGLAVDTRSDIYALGVVLYELLTGTTPCDRERLRAAGLDEVRRIIREEEPAPPSTRVSTLGPQAVTVSANRRSDPQRLSRLCRGELDWIVLKALDKDRNRRYDTASALAADVQRYLNDEPVAACPPSRWYRLRKAVRRNRGLVLAGTLVALALVGGTAAATWGLVRATEAEAVARAEAQHKDQALAEAHEQSFRSLLNEAHAVRFSGRMGQRHDSLDAIARAARIPLAEGLSDPRLRGSRLRDEAIAALALPDLRRGPRWQAQPPGAYHLHFDAAYRLYAGVADDGTISIRTVADNREIRSIRAAPARNTLLRLSPDGRYVARVEASRKLRVWRVVDGSEVWPQPLTQVSGQAFSRDGGHLLVAQPERLVRFDLVTGREVNRWQLPEHTSGWLLAFHPDNRRVAVCPIEASAVSIFDVETGTLLAELPVGPCRNPVVAWHPDGTQLAIGVSRFIQLWDVEARDKRATLEGPVQQVSALDFHPDGTLLASQSWEGTLRLWDVATGRSLLQVPLLVDPQFSRDGHWLGALRHGKDVQLLEATPAPAYRTLGDGRGEYYEGDLSPDNRLLALNRGEEGVCLWDLTTGREVATLARGLPLFAPGGQELLVSRGAELQRQTLAFDGNLQLGAPRTFPWPAPATRVARSDSGRTLAAVAESRGIAWVMDLDTNTIRAPRFRHTGAGYVALSSDGNWVATSGWHAAEARLWDAHSGRLVHEWPVQRATVAFTPDARTLVLGLGDEFRFHDVATQALVRRIEREVPMHPGHVAFAPAAGLMALELAPGVVQLQESTTGTTVARLEDPHGDRAAWLGLASDAGRLAVVAPYARAVHVWDLFALARELRGLNLAWDGLKLAAPPERRSGD
jgi:serine/threonine protein kinase/WD40 repeat protein